MKALFYLIALFVLLSCVNQPSTPNSSKQDQGMLEGWGKGSDPWLLDSERKYREQVKEAKKLQSLTKSKA